MSAPLRAPLTAAHPTALGDASGRLTPKAQGSLVVSGSGAGRPTGPIGPSNTYERNMPAYAFSTTSTASRSPTSCTGCARSPPAHSRGPIRRTQRRSKRHSLTPISRPIASGSRSASDGRWSAPRPRWTPWSNGCAAADRSRADHHRALPPDLPTRSAEPRRATATARPAQRRRSQPQPRRSERPARRARPSQPALHARHVRAPRRTRRCRRATDASQFEVDRGGCEQ